MREFLDFVLSYPGIIGAFVFLWGLGWLILDLPWKRFMGESQSQSWFGIAIDVWIVFLGAVGMVLGAVKG